MAEKRFYWLKLKQDFFEQDDIKIVESMKNGKDYIIFLLKLQLKSINTEGHLLFKNTIPYSDEMLSTITNTNIDIVRAAITVFLQLGMVERLDDGTLFMTEVQNLIGSEGQSAERVRRYRENKENIALLCNGDVTNSNDEVTKSNEHIDIEIEQDIKEDIEKKKSEVKYTEEFERFYKLYPNPFNKSQTFKNWKNRIKTESVENIMKATEKYIAYLKARKTVDRQYMVRSTNFIGQNAEYKGYLEMEVKVEVETDRSRYID